MDYQIRLASHEDVAEIETVMRDSLEVLGRSAYDETQVASAQRHTAFLDVQMVDDGTYYVVVAGDRIAGCGGWSRRAKLFPGSTAQEKDLQKRLVDKATEPARIRAMFVDPGHSRRGLGRRLLEASENAARAEGFLVDDPLGHAFGYRALPGLRLCGGRALRLRNAGRDRASLYGHDQTALA